MSNWTHVAGIIRVDAFRLENALVPNWDEVFGKELLYGESYEKWKEANEHPELYLPIGSEGSLQKSVWVNSDKSNITSYVVSIFGDLRDHDSSDEIVEWFKEKCNVVNTRQATIVVTNGFGGSKVWSYSFGEELK